MCAPDHTHATAQVWSSEDVLSELIPFREPTYWKERSNPYKLSTDTYAIIPCLTIVFHVAWAGTPSLLDTFL